MINKKADILFEVSWEVCNKVGGINTVLKSKSAQIRKYYKGHEYYLIGPYFADKVAGEFEEELAPKECKELCNELKNQGIILHFGKWLIKKEPRVILIDFQSFMPQINEVKRALWENFKIDSMNTGTDYNDPVAWAFAAGKVLEKIKKVYNKKIVAQFHEWLAGAALLYLKMNKVNIATIFTTHATVLGRTLASANVNLYCTDKQGKCILETIDMEKAAYEHHVEAKHQVEKQAALNSDVFTTVSEVTGVEANFVLKRTADVLLPNGLDMNKFPTFEEASVEHRFHRDQAREFILYYFFPYYQFDIKNTLLFFLAGRYEFRDKGIDIYIRALDILNRKLKNIKTKKTIVAFIFVPAAIRGIKPELLENKTLFNDIKDALSEDMPDIKKNILYTILSREKLTENHLFSREFITETKKRLARLKKKGAPPLMTHDLQDSNDVIVQHLFGAGLDNQKDDKVNVIFYPIYLTGADSLLDLTYYEAMSACHLGVFPSFYEPWGYTPLEAAALGVSSVTTDLAGFGRFILEEKQKEKHPGIFVLKRMDRTDDQIANDLANFMYKFTRFSRHDRVLNKIEAKRLATRADWKYLIKHYIESQNLAVEKIFK